MSFSLWFFFRTDEQMNEHMDGQTHLTIIMTYRLNSKRRIKKIFSCFPACMYLQIGMYVWISKYVHMYHSDRRPRHSTQHSLSLNMTEGMTEHCSFIFRERRNEYLILCGWIVFNIFSRQNGLTTTTFKIIIKKKLNMISKIFFLENLNIKWELYIDPAIRL